MSAHSPGYYREDRLKKNMTENAKLDKKTLSGVVEIKDNLIGLRSDNDTIMYRCNPEDNFFFLGIFFERKGKDTAERNAD